MKKIVSFIFLLLFISIPTFAMLTIKGKIVDASTKEPLEFVNVALFKQDSKVPTTGVTSDKKGDFTVPPVKQGKYTLKISYVGYNDITLPLNVTDKELNMGIIKLLENSKDLNEVEVVGQGTQMHFEVDKKVFTVDQNIASAGGSATEVLQNIPSVDVDNEGNISLRNDANVEVWINGKPSGLTADNRAQILQQMPAESIKSIEIMTNPSAKFDPEGTAGIINIVLKKDRKAGYYGSASVGGFYADQAKPGQSAGFNFNYNSSKVDAYFNAGFRHMSFHGGSKTDRYNLTGTDTTSVLNQNSINGHSFHGVFLRGGVDYHADDKNTFSFATFGFFGTGKANSTVNNIFTDNSTSTILKNYDRNLNESGFRQALHLDVDYEHDFDTKGTNLISSLSFSNFKRGGGDRYTQTDYLGSNNQDYTQSLDGSSSRIEFKTDYTKKFSENSKLEAGWQSTIRNRYSPASAIDNMTNQEIEAYYNVFNYDEQDHAAYLTYGNRLFDKLTLQGGLRAEYYQKSSDYTYKDQNDNWASKTVYLNYDPVIQLFPSAFLSYTLPNNNELQLNYTRRINRPRGRQINPFRDFSDSTNIRYGNPDLDPEYSSSLELNYLKTWDEHSISASTYYRYTDQVIQRVSFIHNGTMESTYMNLAKSTSAGVELVAKDRLFKIVDLTTSLNMYYNKLDSSTYFNPYDNTIKTTIPEQQNFTWSGRMMANILLGRTTNAQITGHYSAPRLIAQGRQTSSYSIDLGVRKTFLKKSLSLNLMVRDLLNSRKRNSVTWGDGFYQTSESYFHGRMIGLTLTYNFGNMNPSNKKKSNNNQQDNGQQDNNMMDSGMD